MAEAAGLAVGVFSFGIQICQGLVNYYTQFRGAKDDIDAVITSVEGLRAMLKTVESMTTNVTDPNNPALKQVEKAMKDCEEGLKRLDTMRMKCLDTRPPGSLQEKIKYAKNRLCYPFRKDTLNELQTVVDRLQTNLQTSLQILGIDATGDRLDNVDVALHGIDRGIKALGACQQQQTTSVTTELKHQTSLLNAQETSLNTVQCGMTALSASVQDQGSSVHLQLATQNFQIENHTTLLQDIRGDTNTLITSYQSQALEQAKLVKQLRRYIEVLSQQPIDPAEIHGGPASQSFLTEEALVSYLEPHPFQRTLRRYNDAIQHSRSVGGTESSLCTCMGYGQRERSHVGGWLSSTISQSRYDHAPECPLFPHTDFSVEVGKQFRVHARWFLFVGFTRSRKGGILKMFPSLSFRAVVSEDSPAFRLLNETFHDRELKRYRSLSEIESYFHSFSEAMKQVIGETPSRATDTLSNGENLLHYACRYGVTKYVHLSSDVWIRFLGLLIGLGVPIDGRDDSGRAPMDWLLEPVSLREEAHLVRSFVVGKVDTWQFGLEQERMNPRRFQAVKWLLATESVMEKFDPESAFQEAILQRSAPKLQHVLHKTKASWDCASLDSGGLNLEQWAHYAFWWQEGARLILKTARRQSGPTLRWTNDWILRDCVWWGSDLRSVRFWLQQACPVTSATWAAACHPLETGADQDAVIAILAHELGKKLQDPAESAALQGLYHVKYLSKFAAARLWDAGFREADLDEYKLPCGTRKIGTPLWKHSYDFAMYPDLLEWFVWKGARLDWPHPQWASTPRTSIGRNMVDILHKSSRPVTSSFFKTVLWSSSPDKCDCLCSEGGCIPFAWAFRWITIYPDSGELQHADQLCQTIAHALIRRATFDALSMTHTCCSRQSYLDECDGYSPLQSENDILEVRHVEIQDAELLKSLTAEFNHQVERYEGTLAHFFQKIWMPRMDAILLERDSGMPNIQKIQELGIHLEETSEAHPERKGAHLDQVSVTCSESESETYHLEELFELYPDYESVHREGVSETYSDYVPSHPHFRYFAKCARHRIRCVSRTGSIRRLGQVCSCWMQRCSSDSFSEYESYIEE